MNTNYAGFWMRFVAIIIDGIIIGIIRAFLVVPILATIGITSKYQATVGKLALGLIVTDMNGAKLDFSKSLVRNLGKILSNFIFLIGYIMAAFTEKKQSLHDIIAGTLVVQK